MSESIAELQKEECIKVHINDIFGKNALKGVQWGHGRTWKKAYRSLIKDYRAAFPRVLKARDVKVYS